MLLKQLLKLSEGSGGVADGVDEHAALTRQLLGIRHQPDHVLNDVENPIGAAVDQNNMPA